MCEAPVRVDDLTGKTQLGWCADLLTWLSFGDPEQCAFPTRHCAGEALPVLSSFARAGRTPAGLCVAISPPPTDASPLLNHVFGSHEVWSLRLTLRQDEDLEKVHIPGIVHFSQRVSWRNRGASEDEGRTGNQTCCLFKILTLQTQLYKKSLAIHAVTHAQNNCLYHVRGGIYRATLIINYNTQHTTTRKYNEGCVRCIKHFKRSSKSTN